MEHQYRETLRKQLEEAQQEVIDAVEDMLSDEHLEDVRSYDEDGAEWLEDARAQFGANLKPDYQRAAEIFDALELAGGVAEYDYTAQADKVEQEISDITYTLSKIEALIEREAQYIVSVDTSTKSVSTYLTVRIDGLDDFEALGEVTGTALEDDDTKPETFTVRISDHQPGGRFGDYGRIEYGGGDIEIDAATLR